MLHQSEWNLPLVSVFLNSPIVEAHKPIRKTLRPCPAESVDWDTTENLYIEGC